MPRRTTGVKWSQPKSTGQTMCAVDGRDGDCPSLLDWEDYLMTDSQMSDIELKNLDLYSWTFFVGSDCSYGPVLPFWNREFDSVLLFIRNAYLMFYFNFNSTLRRLWTFKVLGFF